MGEKLSNDLFACGQIIREPIGSGNGYWAGAPGAFYAKDERAWYLTYRLRRPRGVPPDRGGEARIARSGDLEHWEDVWCVTKDKYSSASIERSAIHKGSDGQWRYFTSFVDPADGRWCIALLKADKIGNLDPTSAHPVFKAAPLGLEGIKDPWLFEWQGVFYMMMSVAIRTPQTNNQSHSTSDIFNTGECVSATGLAISRDLDHWDWHGIVFAPEQVGWDRYCRRLNSVVSSGEKFFGFYDGSASHKENYEEKTGLAVSNDLKNWQTLLSDAPKFTSPFASKSLRYLDAHVVGPEAIIFYEFARADGAHDLRFIKCEVSALGNLI